jgi:hypothetical protein
MAASRWEASVAISPDPLAEQKAQPVVPLDPSLLGHVKPPSRDSLTTLPPNFFFRYVFMVFIRSFCPSDESNIIGTPFSFITNLLHVFSDLVLYDIIKR